MPQHAPKGSRRVKDGGITLNAAADPLSDRGHDGLSKLGATALQHLRDSVLGPELEGIELVLVLVHPDHTRHACCGDVEGADDAACLAGMVGALVQALGTLGKLVPDVQPHIRELLHEIMGDG